MNGSKKLAAALAAGALTLGIGALTATAALAQPTTIDRTRDLAAEKVRCTAAIDVRLPELTKLTAALNGAKNVTDAHKSAQLASLSAATMTRWRLSIDGKWLQNSSARKRTSSRTESR